MSAGKRGSYTFEDKVRAFCKGLIRVKPFRQIALEGLRRGVSGQLEERYAKRLSFWGISNEIRNALASGCSENAQEILAKTFKKRFDDRNALYDMALELDISEHVKKDIRERKKQYKKETAEQVRSLLGSGKITSEKAKKMLHETSLRQEEWHEAVETQQD